MLSRATPPTVGPLSGVRSVLNAGRHSGRLTTPGTTVAYLDIRNNGHADRLIAVHTSVGGTVQLRAAGARHAGTLTMYTVTDIPVPADSLVQLNPDTYHLLITGAGPMHDGKDIWLRLTFANAGTITVLALVTNPQSGGSSYFLN